MPLVSVIIPVYNVETYLPQCLDSVLAQTLQEIEIICVDDGSTDSCPAILDEYARRDARVRVIRKENGGYGQAMNVGMAAAKGNYIGIVESDDYILPYMYQILYDWAEGRQLDFVKCNYTEVWSSPPYCRNQECVHLCAYQNVILEGEQCLALWSFSNANWAGLYRTSFLRRNNILHRESPGASYQDIGFWIQLLAHANRVAHIGDALYCYRQDNPASSVRSREKMLYLLQEYQFATAILEKEEKYHLIPYCNRRRLLGHKWNFERICDERKRQYIPVILQDYEEFRDNIYWQDPNEARSVMNWLSALQADPVGVCEQYEHYTSRVISQLTQATDIVIYGAGQVGKGTFGQLLHLGYGKKLQCFVETAPDGKGEYMGIPVMAAAQVIPTHPDSLVVVAVSHKNGLFEEITAYLQQLGCDNYMDFLELRQPY